MQTVVHVMDVLRKMCVETSFSQIKLCFIVFSSTKHTNNKQNENRGKGMKEKKMHILDSTECHITVRLMFIN